MYLVGGNASLSILGLLSGVIVARALGAEGRAVFGVITSTLGLCVSLWYFSLNEAVVRVLRLGYDVRKTIFKSLFLSLAASMPAIASFYVIYYQMLRKDYSLQNGMLLAYVAICVFSLNLIYPLVAYAQAEMRVFTQNVARIIPPTAHILMMIAILVFASVSVELALVSLAVSSAVALAVVIPLSWSRMSPALQSRNISATLLFRESRQLHITAIPLLLCASLDKVLLFLVPSKESVGLYFVAIAATSAIPSALTQAARVFGFAELSSVESNSGSRTQARHFIRKTSSLSILSILISLFVAPTVIYIFFGSEFRGSIFISFSILFFIYSISMRSVISNIARAQGVVKPVIIYELYYAFLAGISILILHAYGSLNIWTYVIAFNLVAFSSLILAVILTRKNTALSSADFFYFDRDAYISGFQHIKKLARSRFPKG